MELIINIYQYVMIFIWCPHTDSNRGPTDYKLHVPYFHRFAWIPILFLFSFIYSNISYHSIAWYCIKAYVFCNPYVTQR